MFAPALSVPRSSRWSAVTTSRQRCAAVSPGPHITCVGSPAGSREASPTDTCATAANEFYDRFPGVPYRFLIPKQLGLGFNQTNL